MALKLLLETRMGLDLASVGQGALDAALRVRLRATGTSHVDAYTALVQSSEQELRALIEEMVVSETWFMRDRLPFLELARLMAKRREGRAVRVLSVPCATGEEAYSIAITLREAALPSGFSVDGVDISERALEIAKRGLFADHSFRGNSETLQRAWFTSTREGWLIHPEVKSAVTFRHGNVLDENLARGVQYDAIFCRNLLIYLGTEARRKAISVLTSALAPGGAFFAGHAESMHHIDRRFTRLGAQGAFAYIVGPPPSAANVAMKRNGALATPHRPQPEAPRTARAPEPELALDYARRLADCGQLPEALRACEAYLARQPVDPQAHLLAGLILQAMGDALGAEKRMERALYLDPLHAEAIEHLSPLYARRGNLAGLEGLHQRAARARQRKESP